MGATEAHSGPGSYDPTRGGPDIAPASAAALVERSIAIPRVATGRQNPKLHCVAYRPHVSMRGVGIGTRGWGRH
eukprot:scaffold57880_cov62-Phaeocystis_antarctica.AAC.1